MQGGTGVNGTCVCRRVRSWSKPVCAGLLATWALSTQTDMSQDPKQSMISDVSVPTLTNWQFTMLPGLATDFLFAICAIS
jgi:hypothetical protein